MADIKQQTATSQTLSSSQAAVSNGAVGTLAADLNNTTALAFTFSFDLNAGFGTSVSANSQIDLYLVPKLDGTNASAVDTSTPVFQPDHYAGTFVTPTTGTATRRMSVQNVRVGPYAYTVYLHNRSGVQVSSSYTLIAYPELVQSV